MKDAVLANNITADIQFYKITGSSLHAFNYWHAINNSVNPPVCVSSQVIAFLDAHK